MKTRQEKPALEVALLMFRESVKSFQSNSNFEMSMLLSSPRTATATATEPATRLVGLSKKNFELILQDNPQIVLAILKEMTQRLKDTGGSRPAD
jgi:CRP-like cAMP-binding protein